jgi:hypothetical protein
VLAWDPVTNQPKLETVLATSSRITDDIFKLTLADAAGRQSTTTFTGNHPYLLAANDNAPLLALAANDNGPASGPGYGQAAQAADTNILRIEPGGDWKIVRHLSPGDRIRTALNGAVVGGHLVSAPGMDTLTVVSVALDRSPRRVHNLEVSNLHSFAVGELGEWVQNGWREKSYEYLRNFLLGCQILSGGVIKAPPPLPKPPAILRPAQVKPNKTP